MANGAINRERYQRLANRYRTRMPSIYGVRQWRVFLRAVTSSGSHTGDGDVTYVETEILQNQHPPKVREQNSETALFSGDSADVANYTIGPLTQVVGTPWAVLLGDGVSSGEQWQLRLLHAETGESIICRIYHVTTDRALHTIINAAVLRREIVLTEYTTEYSLEYTS
jgi:hypothetical protein